MNTKSLITVAALALVGASAFAADTPSSVSRADVVAELVRARAAGETNNYSESFGYTMQTPQQQATAFAKSAPQPAAATTPVATNNAAPAVTTAK